MKLVIELYLSGGDSGKNVLQNWFRWSGFTQKRAQSTGNRMERLWKKNLDQKVILEKKLEHFSKKKLVPQNFGSHLLRISQPNVISFGWEILNKILGDQLFFSKNALTFFLEWLFGRDFFSQTLRSISCPLSTFLSEFRPSKSILHHIVSATPPWGTYFNN